VIFLVASKDSLPVEEGRIMDVPKKKEEKRDVMSAEAKRKDFPLSGEPRLLSVRQSLPQPSCNLRNEESDNIRYKQIRKIQCYKRNRTWKPIRVFLVRYEHHIRIQIKAISVAGREGPCVWFL
jgi:hypothetical protein